MAIKKSYEDIVKFLEANQNKKVSSILDEVYLMAESKKQSSTVMKDENDNVIAIFCYYHKQWELVSEVEYGKKANSTTGLNTMCKVGVSKWTKAQRDAKNANVQLLDDLANEKIKPADIKGIKADIEYNRTVIDETDMPKGFASEQEVLEYIASK